MNSSVVPVWVLVGLRVESVDVLSTAQDLRIWSDSFGAILEARHLGSCLTYKPKTGKALRPQLHLLYLIGLALSVDQACLPSRGGVDQVALESSVAIELNRMVNRLLVRHSSTHVLRSLLLVS